MKTVNAEILNKSTTSQLIFAELAAQQANASKRKGLPVVPTKVLRAYAKQCFKAFKANLKLCVSPKDHERLARFKAKKVNPRGDDFLNALATKSKSKSKAKVVATGRQLYMAYNHNGRELLKKAVSHAAALREVRAYRKATGNPANIAPV